jgi:hypothetical protein
MSNSCGIEWEATLNALINLNRFLCGNEEPADRINGF